MTNDRNQEYLEEVTMQAIGYCAIYMNQFVWLMAGFALAMAQIDPPYGFHMLSYFMISMNGFFNAIVYIQPSLNAVYKRHNKMISKMKALWFVIQDTPEEASVRYLGERNQTYVDDADEIPTPTAPAATGSPNKESPAEGGDAEADVGSGA